MKKNIRVRFLTLILLSQIALALCVWSFYYLGQLEIERAKGKTQRTDFKVVESLVFRDQDALKEWDKKVFKGKTDFRVVNDNGAPYLKTISTDDSIGLYKKVDHKVEPNLYITWRWRAITFPQKKEPEKLANRKEDDFAARLYIVFPGSTFFNTNVIEYIWDENLPIGTLSNSPFSGRVKLFVVESGKPQEGEDGWRQQERNIYDDYVQLYGKPPKRNLGAIAVMSDSDNTKTQAESDFGTIVLKTQ